MKPKYWVGWSLNIYPYRDYLKFIKEWKCTTYDSTETIKEAEKRLFPNYWAAWGFAQKERLRKNAT